MTSEPRTSTDGPVFILCFARSGSTLLRVLLDAHPELASPPETSVARVCETTERAWRQVCLSGGRGPLPTEAIDEIRSAVDRPMRAYARARGKRLWADKSLDNLFLAPLLSEVFPQARFVALHRHCLDFVMSGLDASRWGFAAYGFEKYVQKSPGNTVHALVRYWCDHTEALLSYERRNPDRTVRVRYEDLARDPDHEMSRLTGFLGVEDIPGLSRSAFVGQHDIGAGDHKLPFTDRVSAASVGTGRRVPVHLIPADLMQRMNECLRQLDHPEVGPDWNALPSEGPAGEGPDRSARTALADVLGGDDPAPRLCSHEQDRLRDHVLVTIEDRQSSWLIDPATGEASFCDRPCLPPARILTDSATLRGVVTGEANIGGVLRTGALRAVGGVSRVADVVAGLRARHPAAGSRALAVTVGAR
ncbi:sulfotransferase family protein [Micromonospora sp. WMMD736]|uniref:sulfotransferase family protein n=1 Tax=Micromonospora sp. WMMD736 TaxID=3404112 RepID=UPI003B93EEA5